MQIACILGMNDVSGFGSLCALLVTAHIGFGAVPGPIAATSAPLPLQIVEGPSLIVCVGMWPEFHVARCCTL